MLTIQEGQSLKVHRTEKARGFGLVQVEAEVCRGASQQTAEHGDQQLQTRHRRRRRPTQHHSDDAPAARQCCG